MIIPGSIERVLLDEETIQQRVKAIAAQISADYRDVKDIILVGVLKGSFIFLADLARNLTVPHHIDFVALSSYGAQGATSGAVR